MTRLHSICLVVLLAAVIEFASGKVDSLFLVHTSQP